MTGHVPLDGIHMMKPLGFREQFADSELPVERKADRDETEMARFGKRQQLKRNFGLLSMIGFSCTLMCTWEGMLVVFLYGFENGGPAGLVYGYIFCWIGTLAIVASMAEMASMIPLSGGQYHWVYELAPESSKKFLSYVTGWSTVLAWQAATASAAYLGGTIIQGLLVLNYPNYVFERWHGTLLFYAVIVVTLFFNTYLASQLPKIEGLALIIHVVGFFGILIPLVYLAPHGTAHDVFATFINAGGWQTNGLSFFIGIITSVYSFLGADSACHMAEEIQNASTIVPWSIILTIVVNGILGFGMLLAVLFCLGNAENALVTPTGYPFLEIFQQATNSTHGATAMASVVTALDIFATFGLLATASRMLWAFARDKGLPFSNILGRVDSRTSLPIYSIALSVLINFLLALINIGSSAAFNAIISLVVAGFFSSYLISIGLMLVKRYQTDNTRWGPWRMGRWGIFVNIVALIFIVIALFFSFFPSTLVVTPVTMNWSCLVYGSVVIFSTVYYFAYGRRHYSGPIVEVHVS